MQNRLVEKLQFVLSFLKSPKKVGALLPSSKKLGQKIIRKIPHSPASTPSHYLEIGAGTGAFTQQIVNRLGPNDHLDIVEFDAKFCSILRKKYSSNINVSIHQVSILDFQSKNPYDVIISGLPLNAFPANTVERIFHQLAMLTKNQGHISYFEYIGLAKIKQILLFGRPFEDFQALLKIKRNFKDLYPTETDLIWLNLTPARVRHCNIIRSESDFHHEHI